MPGLADSEFPVRLVTATSGLTVMLGEDAESAEGGCHRTRQSLAKVAATSVRVAEILDPSLHDEEKGGRDGRRESQASA